MAERQTAIEACEKAVAFTHAKPDKPAPQVSIHKTKCFGMVGGEKVDAIPYYQSEIERFDSAIDAERAATCAFAHSAHLQESTHSSKVGKFLSSVLKSGKEAEETDTAVDTAIVADTTISLGASADTNDDGGVKKDANQVLGNEQDDKEESNTDDDLDIARNDSDEIKLLSDTDATDKPSDDDMPNGTHEGETSSTGFVTFTSLRAKQAAIQVRHCCCWKHKCS